MISIFELYIQEKSLYERRRIPGLYNAPGVQESDVVRALREECAALRGKIEADNVKVTTVKAFAFSYSSQELYQKYREKIAENRHAAPLLKVCCIFSCAHADNVVLDQ
jgi:hypothetical protein